MRSPLGGTSTAGQPQSSCPGSSQPARQEHAVQWGTVTPCAGPAASGVVLVRCGCQAAAGQCKPNSLPSYRTSAATHTHPMLLTHCNVMQCRGAQDSRLRPQNHSKSHKSHQDAPTLLASTSQTHATKQEWQWAIKSHACTQLRGAPEPPPQDRTGNGIHSSLTSGSSAAYALSTLLSASWPSAAAKRLRVGKVLPRSLSMSAAASSPTGCRGGCGWQQKVTADMHARHVREWREMGHMTHVM